jgi:excisionase family DNA binding protein
MTGRVSPRSAELALVALQEALRLTQYRRSGRALPADLAAALDELRSAASAPTRGIVDTQIAPVPPSEQIDTQEAARRLGVAVRTVQERCAAGRLPATRIGRRSWLVRWEDNSWDSTS